MAQRPKPVANPIFIRQIAGERLLEQPRDRLATRRVTPLPC